MTVTEPTLRAVCGPAPTEELISWLTDTLVELGWNYDGYSVEPGYPILRSGDAPDSLSEVYDIAVGKEHFSISLSKRFPEGDWGGYVSVDQRRYEECVAITVHAIKRLSTGVKNDFLNTAVAIANDSRTLALGADVTNGVPLWHQLPSSHEFSPKDSYPGTFNYNFEVQMGNLTLFPPNTVAGVDAELLVELGQVIRTASGPLLIVCEEVLACTEPRREEIADELGIEAKGY